MAGSNPESDLERIRLRKSQATAAGGQAFLRLLMHAETGSSGQAGRIARFLAATYDGNAFPLNLCDLRTVDEAIGDDMLLCIGALRWGQADLFTLVPDGDRRMRAVIELWGLPWPGQS